MKKSILSMLLLLFTVVCFAQKAKLVGTWKLVSGKAMAGDSTYPYDDKNTNSIKIVTPTHFAVITQTTDNVFQHAGAGTIQADDKTYTEHIMYGDSKDWIGKDVKFTYTLEGDKWHIKGGLENVMSFDEVWQRVK